MGGFLGIGESGAEKQLKHQKELARQEAERARRDAEIAQAERTAKKGQETANIKLGAPKEEEETEINTETSRKPTIGPSSSLGLGGLGKKKQTGIQV